MRSPGSRTSWARLTSPRRSTSACRPADESRDHAGEHHADAGGAVAQERGGDRRERSRSAATSSTACPPPRRTKICRSPAPRSARAFRWRPAPPSPRRGAAWSHCRRTGSAMYTLQALWTQARERLPITTVLLSNRKYQYPARRADQCRRQCGSRRARHDGPRQSRPRMDQARARHGRRGSARHHSERIRPPVCAGQQGLRSVPDRIDHVDMAAPRSTAVRRSGAAVRRCNRADVGATPRPPDFSRMVPTPCRGRAQTGRPDLRRGIRCPSSWRTDRYWRCRSRIRRAPCQSPSGRASERARRHPSG